MENGVGVVNHDSLTNIAEAIREKNYSETQYKPSEMAQAIRDLPQGISDVTSVTITNKADFEDLHFDGNYLTIPLEVAIEPQNAPKWTQVLVSDSKMARVLDNGDGTHSLHIIKGGTCEVEVQDYSGQVSDKMTINIDEPLVDIAFAAKALNIVEGGTRQLHVIFTPSTATDQTLVWKSDHKNIEVDQKGLVTANGSGHATISARSEALDKTITMTVDVATYVDAPDWASIKANRLDYGVGSEFKDKLTYNNKEYDIVYRVVAQDYSVIKADGSEAKAMILLPTQSLPFTNAFSTLNRIQCDAETEPTAQAETYYYGRKGTSGSDYTRLELQVGDPLPYSDYDSIYKSGLNYTKGFSALNNTYINRWDGSEVRAILNSDADNVSTSYEPVHITDTVKYTGKGFLQMINPNLISVVEKIKNTTVDNNNCFEGETYTTEDLFWLPSVLQMDGKYSDSCPDEKRELEGKPFDYFANEIGNPTSSSAPSRVVTRLDASSPSSYWLRSAYYSTSYYELYSYSSGSTNSNDASNTNALLPDRILRNWQ